MVNLAVEAFQVAVPITSLSEIGSAVEELVLLQKRAAEIERRAKVLRGEIREGMVRTGLRKFSSQTGHTATIVDSTSWRGDKEAAEALIGPALVAAIFRVTTTTALRVK